MGIEQQQQIKNLTGTSDRELISGKLGVFAEHWRRAPEVPERSGSYLVSVLFYEPIVALYIEKKGWHLNGTEYVGLEDGVKCWMPLPEPWRK